MIIWSENFFKNYFGSKNYFGPTHIAFINCFVWKKIVLKRFWVKKKGLNKFIAWNILVWENFWLKTLSNPKKIATFLQQLPDTFETPSIFYQTNFRNVLIFVLVKVLAVHMVNCYPKLNYVCKSGVEFGKN